MFKDKNNKWRHTPEEIEKIRQANLKRDYNVVFTEKTRKKLAISPRNRVWTDESREKARMSHLGKTLSEEQKLKIKEHGKYGWKNNQWKGRFSGYAAKHLWALRHFVGPKVCFDALNDSCNCSGRIEMSNKDHRYRKNMNDWRCLCTYHHRKYDKQHGYINSTNEKIRRIYSRFGNIQVREITIDGLIINI